MIRFACPSCEKVYTVPASAGAKPATCKQCGTRFMIPDAPPSVEYEVVEEPAPVAPPPPPRPSVQHAETMMMPAVPDLPSKQLEIPGIPALPDLNSAPPPPPPAVSSLSFGEPPPPPEAPPETPATVVLAPCPTCGARLTVNAEDVGAHVECPMCKSVFQGQAAPTPTVVVPSPPPPPEPADVDIAPCPKCRAELTVSETDLGQDVECPHCQTVYTAARPQPKAGTQLAKSVRGAAPPPSKSGDDNEGKKKPYEFKPKAKKKEDSPFADDDNEDDDDRPSRRKKKKRRSRRDDDDDDDDVEDRRHRSYAPHDGVLNLVLAIVAFFFNGGGFCCGCVYVLPPILAVYVIIKSSLSIGEIQKGLMDPNGRVMLEIARVLAILSILVTVGMIVLRFVFRAAILGGGGGYDNPNDDF